MIEGGGGIAIVVVVVVGGAEESVDDRLVVVVVVVVVVLVVLLPVLRRATIRRQLVPGHRRQPSRTELLALPHLAPQVARLVGQILPLQRPRAQVGPGGGDDGGEQVALDGGAQGALRGFEGEEGQGGGGQEGGQLGGGGGRGGGRG